MEDRQILNPKEFAYHFVDSIPVENNKERFEANAKNKLVAYLTAYYLAEKFNGMEGNILDSARDKKVEDMSLSELMQKVSELSYF
ncbi:MULTISPECIES: hypothetical protein [Companilactobacillus]|uniref:Uncharacterized protein n=1 Tax=Companilactobacillus keshanensis TaxID=2486003 RepID=A0ABW4BRR4_9LACO|nr:MULTISPECIES: hypothetical protein [Companilactobacillus]